MQLGIDFGTTRTLVAAADRGNFPVVSFATDDGEVHDHIPSVVAEVGGALVFGHDALAAAARGAPLVRSFKRFLADKDVSGDTPVQVGQLSVPLGALLRDFLSHVRQRLLSASNAPLSRLDGPLQAVVAVPAHAHAAQRFLTLAAFADAGFAVRAMLHEPSAAGFEFTHRQPRSINSKRTRVVVYDLGGGTFDASLLRLDGRHHDVIVTVGKNRLGGDDFDHALLALGLRESGLGNAVALEPDLRRQLLDVCRRAKEALTPQTRRIVLDFEAAGAGDVTVAVEAFTEATAPLIEETLTALQPLLGGIDDGDPLTEIAGIYLVGGGTALPQVARQLRERFGRRVHRSPHPAASVAIGCCIAAADTGFSLQDRFSRCLGVFRERDSGQALRFDPLLLPDTPLPSAGDAVVIARRYQAAHNIGHYRFVECARLTEEGDPSGDVVPLGEVRFPFDAALFGRTDLASVPVARLGAGPVIEEHYRVKPTGLVELDILDTATGHRRSFVLGAPAQPNAARGPGERKGGDGRTTMGTGARSA